LKVNRLSNDFISAYPITEINLSAKQDTIQAASELLSKQTKYTGAKRWFILGQFRNISKTFWLIQFFCFAAFLLNFSRTSKLEDAQILFLTIVPVMTFYILPEMLKTQIYGTVETEATCFFTPIKSFAVKMILVSVSNILIIGTISLAMGLCHQLNIGELLCYGLIPFNISISLTIIAFDFIKITSPYAMLCVSMLLTVGLMQMQRLTFLLHKAWWGIYWGSVAVVLFSIAITAIRYKHIKGYYYGVKY